MSKKAKRKTTAKRRSSWEWWIAHTITYVSGKGARRTPIRAWENMILIRARSESEARRKATKRETEASAGASRYLSANSGPWDTRPESLRLAGVRLVESVLTNIPFDRALDGEELASSTIIVNSRKDLGRLTRGEKVSIVRDED